MLLNITERPNTWEAVATCQLIQSFDSVAFSDSAHLKELAWLLDAMPAMRREDPTAPLHALQYATAYRAIEYSTEPYIEVLAKTNNIKIAEIRNLELTMDHAPYPQMAELPYGIIACPYGTTAGLNLSHEVWSHIIRLLRTYGLPVYMLGEKGQRLDAGSFLEDEILSNLTNAEKLRCIQTGSTLIVGAPNAWTWLGAALHKKMVILQPDVIPTRRWFWQDDPDIMHLVYESAQIQIPLILTGIRQLIQKL